MAADAQKPPWLIAALARCLPAHVGAEFASDDFLEKACAVGDPSLVSCCLHPGAIPASTRQDVWFRSRSPPVLVVGECEKSTGSSWQASGSESTGFGESPGTAEDALGIPHPRSSPLHLSRRSNATLKHDGRVGHPQLPSAVPTPGFQPGSQHKGLHWGQRLRGWALHQGNRPGTERAGEQNCRPTLAGGLCRRIPMEAPSMPVASYACGDLSFRKERKKKNAVAYPLHSENNKSLGDGACEFSLNCFISYRTATPPRLSRRQSGSFALSPGGMEIRYYNELFLKYMVFISSPAHFRTVPSWQHRRVCKVGERGAGRCWSNCSHMGWSQHHSRRELPAQRWAWLPLPFMFPATGWRRKTFGEKLLGGSKSSTWTQR